MHVRGSVGHRRRSPWARERAWAGAIRRPSSIPTPRWPLPSSLIGNRPYPPPISSMSRACPSWIATKCRSAASSPIAGPRIVAVPIALRMSGIEPLNTSTIRGPRGRVRKRTAESSGCLRPGATSSPPFPFGSRSLPVWRNYRPTWTSGCAMTMRNESTKAAGVMDGRRGARFETRFRSRRRRD